MAATPVTEPCPNCDGARVVDYERSGPTEVTHYDPDGTASICPADGDWRNDDPAVWPHPRA